jgi:hypothetical protein
MVRRPREYVAAVEWVRHTELRPHDRGLRRNEGE